MMDFASGRPHCSAAEWQCLQAAGHGSMKKVFKKIIKVYQNFKKKHQTSRIISVI
jgi:predicted GTPase